MLSQVRAIEVAGPACPKAGSMWGLGVGGTRVLCSSKAWRMTALLLQRMRHCSRAVTVSVPLLHAQPRTLNPRPYTRYPKAAQAICEAYRPLEPLCELMPSAQQIIVAHGLESPSYSAMHQLWVRPGSPWQSSKQKTSGVRL